MTLPQLKTQDLQNKLELSWQIRAIYRAETLLIQKQRNKLEKFQEVRRTCQSEKQKVVGK
mgnify:CR=1 FL=1|jgi:hypothetical protein